MSDFVADSAEIEFHNEFPYSIRRTIMLTTILALATLTLAILLAYQTVILRDMERRLDSLCAHLIEVNHNTDETHALLCQLATADLDVSSVTPR